MYAMPTPPIHWFASPRSLTTGESPASPVTREYMPPTAPSQFGWKRQISAGQT